MTHPSKDLSPQAYDGNFLPSIEAAVIRAEERAAKANPVLSADVAQDAQHLGAAANHKSTRLVSESALDLASQPSAESTEGVIAHVPERQTYSGQATVASGGTSLEAMRRESLEDAYQLVQRLRFASSGEDIFTGSQYGFDVLLRVESYLLNELLREMSVTREFAASA